MKTLTFAILLSASLSVASVQEERLYDEYLAILNSPPSLTATYNEKGLVDRKLFIDALWDSTIEPSALTSSAHTSKVQPKNFEIADALRIEIIKSWPNRAEISAQTQKRIKKEVESGDISVRALTTLFAYSDFMHVAADVLEAAVNFAPDLVRQFNNSQQKFRVKTKQEIKSLFYDSPSLASIGNGEYNNGVRLFMFCRYSRIYKCIMLMKDSNNKPVYQADGKLWHHPSLGMSRYRLPSSVRNGNTPEGVLTIDSVMPEPNKKRVYGKYRRIILNFVPRSVDEEDTKKFLPKSAHGNNWWYSAVVARDAGRNLLRIHGTGIKRSSPKEPNHPLRPTLGCVMQRELKFGKTVYKDQRKLLDKMMVAQGLKPIYKNETKLKGVLYLIELDMQKRAVTYSDIADLLDAQTFF